MTAFLLWALALGLPAVLFVLWPLRRRDAGASATVVDDERVALEAEKRSALRSLRELDLDHEAGHLAADDYGELRARDEARTASVLQRLDALPPPATAKPVARGRPPVAIPWTRQPAVLGGAGLAILAFGVALGVLVSRYSTPAPPDDAATEAPRAGVPILPQASGGAGEPPRALPKELLAGMLQAAHASLDAGRYQEAIAAYKAVLKRDPTNVDAITHLGVILALAGHADDALTAFDRALAIDPQYAHALWDKANLLAEAKQDYAGAIAAWERFVRVAPPGPDRDQALARIKDARTRIAANPLAPPTSASPGSAPARARP